MTILKNLIQDLKNDPSSNIDEAVKKICDSIFDEEKGKFLYPTKMPKGANIFLAIECEGKEYGETGYLCLERDAPGVFFVGYWSGSSSGNSNLKRVKAWDIRETEVEKIMLEYAKILKYLIRE
jgi:hypothetical protein